MAATTDPTPSRRAVVRASGAAVGLGAAAFTLAACGDSEPEADASAAPQETAAESTADAGAGVVAALADVPVGGALVAKVGEESVVVCQPAAGEVKGFSARCTHKGCVVALVDAKTLECPCHHAKFDALTGAVAKGPATEALAPFALAVQGENVVAT